jgi:hypothetical protein
MMHQMNRLGVTRRVDDPERSPREDWSVAAPPPADCGSAVSAGELDERTLSPDRPARTDRFSGEQLGAPALPRSAKVVPPHSGSVIISPAVRLDARGGDGGRWLLRESIRLSADV